MLGKYIPFIIVYYGSDYAGGWQKLDAPLRTVTTVIDSGWSLGGQGSRICACFNRTNLLRQWEGEMNTPYLMVAEERRLSCVEMEFARMLWLPYLLGLAIGRQTDFWGKND